MRRKNGEHVETSDELFRTLHRDDHLFAGKSLETTLTVDSAWAIYHLMRGGVPADPRLLERLADVRPGRLDGLDLDALYRDCDDLWPYVDQVSSALARGCYVVCAWCNKRSTAVPCVACYLSGEKRIRWQPTADGRSAVVLPPKKPKAQK